MTPQPEEILTGLRAAIADTLQGVDRDRVDVDKIHAGTPMLSLPVDSLALMQIVTGVEDRFRVYIPEDRAYAFTTVGEMADFVHEKVVAKEAKRQA